MKRSSQKVSASRHPMATLESRLRLLALSGTHHQPEPPCHGTNRPASGHAETAPTAPREPSRSEDKPHESALGSAFASSPSSGAQPVSTEQRLVSRRRLRATIAARRSARCKKARLARIESRLRSVIRLAPLPVQRLVARMCPRLSSPFSIVVLTQASRNRQS